MNGFLPNLKIFGNYVVVETAKSVKSLIIIISNIIIL